MNADNEPKPTESPTAFERHARELLQESVTRVGANVRSRLNQARQAALEEIAVRPPRSFWRNAGFMPATGALAAAAVVALVLTTHHGAERALPVSDGGQSAYEDIELLADNDGLDLIEGWDNGFYEWAAEQTDDGDGTTG